MNDDLRNTPSNTPPKNYIVKIADNFNYQDCDKIYTHDSFGTYEAAVKACREIVDQCLLDLFKQKTPKNANELYIIYTMFGEDPYIIPRGEPRFSAWQYAEKRSKELCSKFRSQENPLVVTNPKTTSRENIQSARYITKADIVKDRVQQLEPTSSPKEQSKILGSPFNFDRDIGSLFIGACVIAGITLLVYKLIIPAIRLIFSI
jgi:hypothetical protein